MEWAKSRRGTDFERGRNIKRNLLKHGQIFNITAKRLLQTNKLCLNGRITSNWHRQISTGSITLVVFMSNCLDMSSICLERSSIACKMQRRCD